MTDPTELNLLIDKAAEIAGSDYRLAQMLGTQRQVISDWRHGRKTATPADQALMAHIAGLDPIVTLARATVQQYEGKPKGDALMKALGKASRLTGAVAGFVGAVALAISSLIPTRGEAASISEMQCALCQINGQAAAQQRKRQPVTAMFGLLPVSWTPT